MPPRILLPGLVTNAAAPLDRIDAEEIVSGSVLLTWTPLHGGALGSSRVFRVASGRKPPLEMRVHDLTGALTEFNVTVEDVDEVVALPQLSLPSLDADPFIDLTEWRSSPTWEEAGDAVLAIGDGELEVLWDTRAALALMCRVGHLGLLLDDRQRIAGVRLRLHEARAEPLARIIGG